jgi:6-phosphogluconolactonase (cycloisomerase 2 family)
MADNPLLQVFRRFQLHRWSIAALPLLIVASWAWSQQLEPPAEREARIDRLIQQLDDDKFEVREKAEKELAAIGEAARAKLTSASQDGPFERRERAAKLLREIRRAGAGLRHVATTKHEGLAGAVTLVISPDGRFVYVPGFQANAINVFRRDPLTGTLEVQQTLVDPTQLGGVVTVRLSRDGKYAVAAAYASKSITLLSRNAATGELTIESVRQHEPAGELNLVWPIDAIFSIDGKFVYAVDDQGATVVVFAVEGGSKLRLVETFEGRERCFNGARGLIAHPDGKTIYVCSRRPGTLTVLDRDPVSGKLSVRQILRDGEKGVNGLAGATEPRVSRDGKFVYTISGRFEGDNAIGVYQVDDGGTLRVLQEVFGGQGEFENFSGANDLTLSPKENFFYASGTTSCSLACFRRDPASGKLTYLATLQSEATGAGADLGANGLECSSDGRFLYLTVENASAISVFERTEAQR